MLAWIALCAASAADVDAHREKERLERRAERRLERTDEREDRYESACSGVQLAPDDPRLQRQLERTEGDLIDARARSVCLVTRLDAWEEQETTVRVLYATNRAQGRDRRNGPEGPDYSTQDADRVEYGVATVTIPARHPIGSLDDGLVVTRIDPLEPEAFRAAFEEARAAWNEVDVLTYIHGYNNSFEYALRRTAQVAHDLRRPIVPVLFSWPSAGGTTFATAKYTFDENAAARAAPLLADALGTIVPLTEGSDVTVLAHSMGTRVLVDALIDLGSEARADAPFRRVVLAAPDLDANVFARRYLVPVLEAAEELTIYCATDDRALIVSRSVHGGYDRLGSCRDAATTRLEDPAVQIVDATKLSVTIIDHDKVASSPRLLADLRRVLDGLPAEDPARGLDLVDGRFVLPP